MDTRDHSTAAAATAAAPMPRRDQDDLSRLTRQRAAVARQHVKLIQQERLARFEEQLAAEYAADDPKWQELTASAKAAVAEADAAVAVRCRELGIAAEFRPGLHLSWYGRGQNAVASRRAELRKVATTRLAAMGTAACIQIEEQSLAIQSALLRQGLSSGAARAYLDAMPSPADLVPELRLSEIEAALGLTSGDGGTT